MMIKKVIYDSLIIPHMENELDLDEVGLLVSMINDAEADYKDIHRLSELLNAPKKEIETAAEKLIKKGYLKIIDGVYAVNKLKIKDMLLIEPTNNKEGLIYGFWLHSCFYEGTE